MPSAVPPPSPADPPDPRRHAGPVVGDPSGRRVFEILVHEHADMLMAFLRSLVVAPDAIDDLFQETMLVAWRRLEEFDRSRPFGPWLRGIAANLVLAHRRKAGARRTMTCEPAVLEELERQFGALAARPGDTLRQRLEALRRCLDRLPAPMREAIDLAYARGMMIREVALSLGEGEEAIKKRVQRARDALADCFLAAEARP